MKKKQILFVGFIIAVILLFTSCVFADEETSTLQSKIDEVTTGTITLDNDSTEAITIPAGKTITIDLNGHNITVNDKDAISNYGTLKIVGEGTVKSNEGAVVNYPDAEVVIDNGHYNSTGWYAIKNMGTMTINNLYFDNDVNNGSSLVVNGFYGNSTNDRGQAYAGKEVKMTINGGTFENKNNSSAVIKNDDAGVLVINGGTFISYAEPSSSSTSPVLINVHKATINGGTFTSKNGIAIANGYYAEEIDEGELTINGGTFTSKMELFGLSGNTQNKGVMNIIGGTFNGTISNSEKYAGAYYDIKISGGTFSQEVKTVDGYKCVEASSGFDVYKVSSANVGTIENGSIKLSKTSDLVFGDEVSITATAADGYKLVTVSVVDAQGKAITVDNNVFKMPLNSDVTVIAIFEKLKTEAEISNIDTTKPVEEVTVGVSDSEKIEEVILDTLNKEILKGNSEIADSIKGKDVKVAVEIENDVKVEEETKAKIDAVIKKINDDAIVANYFDIVVAVKADGTKVGELSNLSDSIKLSVVLPENLKSAEDGFTRKYYIIRQHGDDVEVLETTLSEDGTYLTFESDKFSTYALAYVDTKIAETEDAKKDDEKSEETEKADASASTKNEETSSIVNPYTGDDIVMYFAILLVAVCGVVTITIIRKKQNKNQ